MSLEKDLLLSERVIRSAFFRIAQTEDFQLVLAWIMEYCGANEQIPDKIKPELVAFQNTFLGMLGLRDEIHGLLQNGQTFQRFTAEARALVSIANMTDIDRRIAEIGEPDGGSNTDTPAE